MHTSGPYRQTACRVPWIIVSRRCPRHHFQAQFPRVPRLPSVCKRTHPEGRQELQPTPHRNTRPLQTAVAANFSTTHVTPVSVACGPDLQYQIRRDDRAWRNAHLTSVPAPAIKALQGQLLGVCWHAAWGNTLTHAQQLRQQGFDCWSKEASQIRVDMFIRSVAQVPWMKELPMPSVILRWAMGGVTLLPRLVPGMARHGGTGRGAKRRREGESAPAPRGCGRPRPLRPLPLPLGGGGGARDAAVAAAAATAAPGPRAPPGRAERATRWRTGTPGARTWAGPRPAATPRSRPPAEAAGAPPAGAAGGGSAAAPVAAAAPAAPAAGAAAAAAGPAGGEVELRWATERSLPVSCEAALARGQAGMAALPPPPPPRRPPPPPARRRRRQGQGAGGWVGRAACRPGGGLAGPAAAAAAVAAAGGAAVSRHPERRPELGHPESNRFGFYFSLNRLSKNSTTHIWSSPCRLGTSQSLRMNCAHCTTGEQLLWWPTSENVCWGSAACRIMK